MSATVPVQQYDAVVAENAALRAQLDAAQRRIDWFTRELFGSKSEKRIEIDPGVQRSSGPAVQRSSKACSLA